MKDFVTILKTISPRIFFTKQFKDGRLIKINSEKAKAPKWYYPYNIDINSLEDFYDVYTDQRGNPQKCMIRDKITIDQQDTDTYRVKNNRKQIRRSKKQLTDVGKHWVTFDFDDAPCPVNWQQHPERAIREVVRGNLPEEFHDKDFVWYFSSSQGVVKGLDGSVNAHVVFWVSEKVTSAQWRGWFKQYRAEGELGDCVDKSLFKNYQAIFFALPKLTNTPNPFKNIGRSGYFDKGKLGGEVEFVFDEDYIEEDVAVGEYIARDMFDVFDSVRAFKKLPHIEAFNKFVDIHTVLRKFGYVLQTEDASHEKYKFRYLTPESTSDSGGVMVTSQGEIISHHESGVFEQGKFYDAWSAYIALEADVYKVEMELKGYVYDDFADIDNLDDPTGLAGDDAPEIDPEELLLREEARSGISRHAPPELVAETRAYEVCILSTLHWLNTNYFMLKQDKDMAFNSYEELGEKGEGHSYFFHTEKKVVSAMNAYVFKHARLIRENDMFEIATTPAKIIPLYVAWRGKNYYKQVGLFFGKGNADQLDLWKGFAVPQKQGDWSLIEYHIREVLCGGDDEKTEYLLDWVANLVQNPDKVFGVAPVIIGKKGTGKTFFGKILFALFDQSQVLEVSDHNLIFGSFNELLLGKVCVVLDEMTYGGNKSTDGKLKTFITSDKLVVSRKFQTPLVIKSHVHTVITSNSEWVVTATDDERRYFVLEISDIHKQDTNYFGKLDKVVTDKRVMGAFLDAMMNRNITTDQRTALRTTTMLKVARHGEDNINRWLLNMVETETLIYNLGEMDIDEKASRKCDLEGLKRKGWGDKSTPDFGDWVPEELYYADYLEFCKARNLRYPDDFVKVRERMKKLGFEEKRIHLSRKELETSGKTHAYPRGIKVPSPKIIKDKMGHVLHSADEVVEEFKKAGILIKRDF